MFGKEAKDAMVMLANIERSLSRIAKEMEVQNSMYATVNHLKPIKQTDEKEK